ncbi:MAG: NADH-quinone oxidoreductase subunit A [Opitutales bacterium]|jgi:NADH-quinone oxidoreductase subunit A|nr:NADH-quinone oxidoreductase subunit A [Opitutales bacterium]MDP4645413.1 NADH-quinone oxidoreductase subunit A [Opitutales bacterium]MDP4693177.1 NADH-quinone oxidoreductase subunit A [Opitutales bacterium]MDP4776399.1 NADH-quinone oxidoreductase subunit A [Opitutales bacterium]MDP4883630.1 NADH-quinone oxidoreductase subunit A [Opitutales bacterium]
MQIADYYPILVQFSIAAGIGAVVLVASHIFGQRGSRGAIKDSPYECGMLAQGSGHARFAVKFYVTAMLFILFDIEVVFLIPWVLIFREFLAAQLPILLPVFFFLFVLVLGLVYELKKGAIEWEK